MIKDYFALAYQSARHRKIRSWLTMVGIFIGIAAVVALVSLSSGLQGAIAQQFAQLGSDKLIISSAESGFGPPGTGVNNPLTINDKDVIGKVNGIDLAIGRLVRVVRLEFNNENKFTYAVTHPEEKEEIDLAVEANNYEAAQGRLLQKSDQFQVMVGSGFAENFFDEEIEVRDKIKIQGNSFEVVGFMKKTGNPQADSYLVIPEDTLRDLLDIEDEYDIIPAQMSAGANPDLVAERVYKDLRRHRDVEEGKEDFQVETPQNILDTLNNILIVVQGVLVGIAAISLIVGGIGIMNTMYTAVHERTREIGIMKALGARNKNISLLFLIESGFLGFFGGLIGVTLGYLISKSVEIIAFQIYESALIQAQFSPFLMIGMLMFGFSVGAISGVFPARQAAKMQPVEALRGD